MDAFFAGNRSVMPFLMADLPEPERERLQSSKDRERYDDTTKCILCAACTSSCPSFWAEDSYVGPAAIVNAHRFIFDSRDDHANDRLDVLAEENGVWRCRTIFNCVDACPRGINITAAILGVLERRGGAPVLTHQYERLLIRADGARRAASGPPRQRAQ